MTATERAVPTKPFSTEMRLSDLPYADTTRELIRLVSHSPELRELLETSIGQAQKKNPDPDTNPVHDLESYYAFVDRILRQMPWEINPADAYDSLYDRVDQGMGCLYFVCDQPLEQLSGKGYFHPSLIYHEPFRSWFVRFLSESGRFLDTPASWCREYYDYARKDSRFLLDTDTYESPEHWHTFNEFFARRLKTPSVRPIASPEDDAVVVSPADACPQGLWRIGPAGRVIPETEADTHGIPIKTGTYSDLSQLLGGSRFADRFNGGTLTHTLLDVYDYHRYHFPVGGIVREVLFLPQDDAPGCVIVWDEKAHRYRGLLSEVFGWQSIETRAVVVLETDAGGWAAVVPVGMCQVSSVNFEPSVVPGARIKKGDPCGYFLFGGSDIIMIFSEDLRFRLTAEPGRHILTGEPYGVFSD